VFLLALAPPDLSIPLDVGSDQTNLDIFPAIRKNLWHKVYYSNKRPSEINSSEKSVETRDKVFR
jgi:hypothetical protein